VDARLPTDFERHGLAALSGKQISYSLIPEDGGKTCSRGAEITERRSGGWGIG
jgi:hypothetical protein